MSYLISLDFWVDIVPLFTCLSFEAEASHYQFWLEYGGLLHEHSGLLLLLSTWTDLELWAGIWTMKSHMDPLNVIGWVGGSVALGSGPKSICPFPFLLWLLRVLPGALIRASLHLLISNAFHFEYMFMCDRLRGHYKTNILILDSTICFLDEAQYLNLLFKI